MSWIDVVYKCHCMSKEATLPIAARNRNEDILDFMGRIGVAIGNDHRKRSPLCKATHMEYAKIPIEGDEIGAPKAAH